MSRIKFGDNNLIVLLNQGFEVAWERVDPAEVDVANIHAFRDAGLDGSVAGTVSSTPTDDERSVVAAFEFGFCYKVSNQFYFFRASFNHVLMVRRVVTHVAGSILFLETSHTVHQIGSAG